MATCTIIKSAPVYSAPDLNTRINDARTVIDQTLPYFSSRDVDFRGSPLVWFEVEWNGEHAWLVAMSGGTYALLDDHDEVPEPVPVGGDWDVLLELACDEQISKALYGFSAGRQGGAQVVNPDGWSWPMSQYTNCICWTAMAMQLARHLLGHSGEMTKADWVKVVLADRPYDRKGGAAVAHEWGIGDEPVNIGGAVKDYSGVLEPGWYVGQGLNEGSDGRLDTDDDTGHGFFLYVDEHGNIYLLESRGRARGGSLGGQDGVGSRNCTPRNARDWTPGQWPSQRTPYTMTKLRATWADLWVSRLR